MSEGEKNRLIAWNREMTAAHERLRRALRLVRDSLAGDGEDPASARADLLLYCKGFCAALSRHHVSEDVALFPELSARHPELRPTIGKLEQDHGMIASLLGRLERVLASDAPVSEVALHLDGISAIMESHFRYEERQLLGILSALESDADPHDYFGPL
ncbi:hemerythrin domain-containing protein [Actinocorallia populi]|uniref:hemerythrin domain-containing protein n=1 Tax=Actinocorallia populi TaxID=2079200 RepID=UPI000D08E65F|nr:hemerythrin domain-containing protein [Actinocorallia populi]